MFKLNEVVSMCREKGCEKFELKSALTNMDVGKKMIVFVSKTESSRIVDNFGRDEDKDVYLGLDKSGWILYRQINQNGAGEFEIIEESCENISDEFVINYLQDDKCTNGQYLQFMKTAYEVCGLYQ